MCYLVGKTYEVRGNTGLAFFTTPIMEMRSMRLTKSERRVKQMRGAPFPCEGERVMTADERSPKPRFF